MFYSELRTGGPANDFRVDAILFRSGKGREFHTGKAWMKATFTQNHATPSEGDVRMMQAQQFDDHLPGSIHQQLRTTGRGFYNVVRFLSLPWEMLFHERFGIRYLTFAGMHGIQMGLAVLTVLDYTGLFRWFNGIASATRLCARVCLRGARHYAARCHDAA